MNQSIVRRRNLASAGANIAGIVRVNIGNKSNKANLAMELISSRAFKLIIEDEEVLKKFMALNLLINLLGKFYLMITF